MLSAALSLVITGTPLAVDGMIAGELHFLQHAALIERAVAARGAMHSQYAIANRPGRDEVERIAVAGHRTNVDWRDFGEHVAARMM